MDELRPLLAIVGLVVVAAGLVYWIARLRGWRSRWEERYFSAGERHGTRAAAGETGVARSERGRGPSSSAAARPREADPAQANRAGTGRPARGSDRQTLIDLDFLPLLDPEDAVGGATTPIDREYDMGDLGAMEPGTAGEPARPARAEGPPSAVRAPDPARPAPGPGPGSGPESGAQASRRASASSARRGPAAGEDRRAAGSGEDPPAPRGTGRELLIVLTILTPGERDLAGPVIREALTAFDLRPDELGMFHHYGNRRGPASDPVFSVANVLEPGVFDLAAMDELATPGLCLFLRRPGPLPATVAFDLMLDVGSRLARALQAVLCDDQRCRLTVQATQALRERVVHFALRHERGAPDAG